MALVTQYSQANEIAERKKIEQNVRQLAVAENFAELESMAKSLRTSKARTSSGLWKLTLFHVGLSASFDDEQTDGPAWSKMEARLKRWQATYPDSATAQLAYADMLINHGWAFRGESYATDVEKKNWKPFHDYIEKARVYLEKQKKTAAIDPYWYQLMEGIAKVQSWPPDKMEKLLDEGLSAEPLFYQLYFGAIDYYIPKWGGSAYAVEKFARKALQRTRSSEGYGMYARIYWYASQAEYDNHLFSESLIDWPIMKKGIDDVLKKYPDAWNLNHFAKFACQAKDKDKTAELISRLKTEVLPEVWESPVNFENCKRWASII